MQRYPLPMTPQRTIDLLLLAALAGCQAALEEPVSERELVFQVDGMQERHGFL